MLKCTRRRITLKSTVEQIRQRFDQDVDRFSKLETGQAATIDAPLVLDLITRAAACVTPHARDVLDIGCGAGNYTLKLLERLPRLNALLLDLSRPMLDRAERRVSERTGGTVRAVQGDVRLIDLGEGQFDIILAAAVLHHLRDQSEWVSVFTKLYRSLRPGGSLWISDLIEHSLPSVHAMMRERYGEYLTTLQSEAYRDEVFAYIEQEDSPRPLLFQLDLLSKVGFRHIELLHKNSVFAAFGALK
jgi:tRNA (cmo5U34)-methyltransferase